MASKVDPTNGTTYASSKPTGAKATKWNGRSTSLGFMEMTPLSITTQKAKLFTKHPSHTLEHNVTRMSTRFQSEMSDYSAFIRTAAALPIDSWMASKWYPDAPNSTLLATLGMTTASHAPMGMYNFHLCDKAIDQAEAIGDKTGARLARFDKWGTSVAQTGLGVGFTGIRVTTIGQTVHPTSAAWAQAGTVTGYVGNTFGALLYLTAGFDSLWERGFCGLFGTSAFEKKYKAKATKKERVAYLKNRLGLDLKKLEIKAVKGQDLYKKGLDFLRPFAKRNIELAVKHGKVAVENGTDIDALADRVIKKFHTKEEIQQVGKDTLIQKLRDKKIQKMQRLIGSEAVKKTIQALAKEKVSKTEVDKIVLGEIGKIQLTRTQKFLFYAGIAVATMILMSIFLTGWGAVAAAILFAVVSLVEIYYDHQKTAALTNDFTAPPGRHDKVVPALGAILTAVGIGVSFVLASVFSMGIVPLAIGVAIGVTFIIKYIHDIYLVDKRRDGYCQHLLQRQGNISLEEFKYLSTYMSEKEIVKHQPHHKLAEEDRKAIEKDLLHYPGLSMKERYLKAIEHHKERLEKRYIDELWKKQEYRRAFNRVEGVKRTVSLRIA